MECFGLGHDVFKRTEAREFFFMDQQFFPTPWSLESWENLADHQNYFLISMRNEAGELCAFCLYDYQIVDKFAHLLKIFVHPNARRQGRAQKLMQESQVILENAGVKDFFLEVEEENIDAQKLYLLNGFKLIHRKKDFYGLGRAGLIMVKKID